MGTCTCTCVKHHIKGIWIDGWLNKENDDWLSSGTQWRHSIVDKKMSAWKREFHEHWLKMSTERAPSVIFAIHTRALLLKWFWGGFISPLVFSNPATIIIGEIYQNESTSLRNCRDRAIRQFLPKNAPGQQVHNFLLQYISAPIIFAIFQSLPQTNRVWFYVLLISRSNNLDFSC